MHKILGLHMNSTCKTRKTQAYHIKARKIVANALDAPRVQDLPTSVDMYMHVNLRHRTEASYFICKR